MNSDRKGIARINIATIATHTIIAAPTTGHIVIDHINLLPSGGANGVTLYNDTTVIADYALDDNQALAFDLPAHNPVEVNTKKAFKIALTAATAVTGFVLYRVVNEV